MPTQQLSTLTNDKMTHIQGSSLQEDNVVIGNFMEVKIFLIAKKGNNMNKFSKSYITVLYKSMKL